MRSSVDFPQPDGPTMQTNSPGAICRSMSSSATTRPCAAHDTPCAGRRCRSPRRAAATAIRRRPPPGIRIAVTSAAARRACCPCSPARTARACCGMIDVALVDDRSAGNSLVAHLVLHVPGLHVEHAAMLISPFGLRAGQGYLCSSSSAGLGAGARCEVSIIACRIDAAVIGLAVVADAAQVGDVVVLHQLLVGLGEIGVDHADRDGQRVRLDQCRRGRRS